MLRFYFVCVAYIVIAQKSVIKCDDNSLIVQTESGKIRGVQLKTNLNQRKFNAFRGIPYAQAPTGSLRFKVINKKELKSKSFLKYLLSSHWLKMSIWYWWSQDLLV